ncbi:MAG: IS5 family transposase [Pseudomonadota bacterium]
MVRRWLRDDQWQRLESMLPGKVGDPGRTGENNRLFIEAVLWIARTGSPWRDLPAEFGRWNSVYKRFGRWSNNGVWNRAFAELAKDADFEEMFLDSTIVRAHQHSSGAAKKKAPQAIGRSRGGLSTKVHTAVDALGNPLRLILSAGQIADIDFATDLIADIRADAVIADKGYDADALVQRIQASGAQAVIPPRSNRKELRVYDTHLYKDRNLIERFFARIKHFRRIATRYEKLARSYMAFLHLVCTFVWLN